MNAPILPPTPGDRIPAALPSSAGKDACRWVRIQIPRFLDAELPPDLAERVSRHLEACEPCRAELAAERDDLLDTIDLLVDAEPPEGLAARIEAALDRELGSARGAAPVRMTASPPAGRRTFARVLPYGPGLAAAATLAFVLWALPREAPETDPDVARAPAVTGNADSSSSHSASSAEAGGAAEIARGGVTTLAALPSGGIGPSYEVGSSDEIGRSPDSGDEMLFSGGIECITFEEAIDTIILGPRLASSGFSAQAGAALLVQRGDIDGNGRFEWRDLQGLYGYLREGREGEAPPACLAAADFDGDGAVTVHDSVIAAQALTQTAGWANHAPEVFAYESDNPLPCRVSCP